MFTGNSFKDYGPFPMKCLCKSKNTQIMGKKDNVDIFRCLACQSVWIHPYSYRIDFYIGNEYNLFQQNEKRKSYHERFLHDYEVARNRFSLIRRLIQPSTSIIDVGCANGAFVKFISDMGYLAYGIDPMKQMFPTEQIFQADFTTFTFNRRFDVVTLFDVLEHFPNQIEVITKICKMSQYLIFIDQPNPETMKDINWKHIRPLEHGFLMSKKFLAQEFNRLGFELIISTSQVTDKMSIIFRKSTTPP